MGVNAQTSVPAFTAGQVLTAAEMTEVNTGIPVFATTTTRDNSFGGSGEKVLAEGQFAYIEATNTTQYYDGAAWQSVGVAPGLVLVKAQTIGSAVGSVTVTDAFSATYENYRIIISGGTGSTNSNIGFTLGGITGSNYRQLGFYQSWGTATITGYAADSTSLIISEAASTGYYSVVDITSPNVAARKFLTINGGGSLTNYIVPAQIISATAATAFTIAPGTGTLSGGTIRIYGYANS